ncbi:DUF2946 family protein [Allopusillimonas soli]
MCRAVVPAGYMPDLSGGRDGRFTITLCTMLGSLQTQQIDLADDAGKSSSSDGVSAQDCPFGLVISQALMPAQDVPLPAQAIVHATVAVVHGHQALPPLPPVGPPLGSRAPPVVLG